MNTPDAFQTGRSTRPERARTRTDRRRLTAGLAALALIAALAGCGSSNSTASSGKSQTATTSPVTGGKATIALSSPIVTSGAIPAQYECVDTKVWIPLQWGTLPTGTRELGLYIASFTPHGSNIAASTIVSGSIMVGLTPSLRALTVGELPKGAIVGVAGAFPGCPTKSSGEKFLFRLYALPSALGTQRGSPDSALLAKLRSEALAIGEFTAGHA